jgi:predicted RNase H-related nuclease YkuK (DUF458 family)
MQTQMIDPAWCSGDGTQVTWDDVMTDVQFAVKEGHRIFVGCDSVKEQKDCTFVVTVCIYNPGAGGRYYFKRFREPTKTFPSLRMRIFREASEAIDVTLTILSVIPNAPVEIHLDVNRDKRYATGSFSDQVVGYAKSIGVDCKIKPDSWASSGIADKHTRARFTRTRLNQKIEDDNLTQSK